MSSEEDVRGFVREKRVSEIAERAVASAEVAVDQASLALEEAKGARSESRRAHAKAEKSDVKAKEAEEKAEKATLAGAHWSTRVASNARGLQTVAVWGAGLTGTQWLSTINSAAYKSVAVPLVVILYVAVCLYAVTIEFALCARIIANANAKLKSVVERRKSRDHSRFLLTMSSILLAVGLILSLSMFSVFTSVIVTSSLAAAITPIVVLTVCFAAGLLFLETRGSKHVDSPAEGDPESWSKRIIDYAGAIASVSVWAGGLSGLAWLQIISSITSEKSSLTMVLYFSICFYVAAICYALQGQRTADWETGQDDRIKARWILLLAGVWLMIGLMLSMALFAVFTFYVLKLNSFPNSVAAAIIPILVASVFMIVFFAHAFAISWSKLHREQPQLLF